MLLMTSSDTHKGKTEHLEYCFKYSGQNKPTAFKDPSQPVDNPR